VNGLIKAVNKIGKRLGMKKIIVLITFILFSTISHSQNRISVGLGYDVAIPSGNFSDIAKTGHNWTVFADYPISPQFSVQLLTGYKIFAIDAEPIAYQGNVITFDLKTIPVKGAVKYFINPDLFLVGEIGVDFTKLSASFQAAYGDPTNQSTDFIAKFTMGGGIGTSFELSEMSSINITSKYVFVDGGDLSIDFSHFLIGAGLVVHFDL
jgi:hypothetical protein